VQAPEFHTKLVTLAMGKDKRVTNTIFRSNASTCPYLWWFWSILDKKPANADAQG
jgi:hypothetical protein